MAEHCDYCPNLATIVDLDANETLCRTDAREMYSADWRRHSHRKLTPATLRRIGRIA